MNLSGQETQAGDLILSLVGSAGVVAEIPSHLSGANLSRAFGLLAIDTNLNIEFVKQFLKAEKTQRWMDEQSQGNAQRVLNLGVLKQLQIPIPPFRTR